MVRNTQNTLNTRCWWNLAIILMGVVFVSSSSLATEQAVDVPLIQQPSGSLVVKASINGTKESDFLLDTGSGLLVVNKKLFRAIKASGQSIEHAGRIAARMADGRHRKMNTYRVENFRIGICELGEIRLAVVPGADRNILGLNALAKAAPFTVSMEPPSLRLAKCSAPILELDQALAATHP